MTGTVRIGVLGRDFLYKYHIADLTEEVINRSIAAHDELVWVIPNFDTAVHSAAANWLKHKHQNIKRLPVEKVFDNIDMAVVFLSQGDEGVAQTAYEVVRQDKVCYVIEDYPKLEMYNL